MNEPEDNPPRPLEDVSPEEYAKRSETYKVGYKKPPKDTQFQKGVPSIRKGKKRKNNYYDDMFYEVATEQITVNLGGKTKKMTYVEACLRKKIQLALNGNPKLLIEFLDAYALSSSFKRTDDQSRERHELLIKLRSMGYVLLLPQACTRKRFRNIRAKCFLESQ